MIVRGGGRERKENFKICSITTPHRFYDNWQMSAIYKFYVLACIHALRFKTCCFQATNNNQKLRWLIKNV